MLQELVSLVSLVVELLGKGRETQLASVPVRLSRSKKSSGSLIVDLFRVPCPMDPKHASKHVLVVLSP